MRLLAAALLFLLMMSCALAQPVTVIGPVTPNNCVKFNSNTVIMDSGVTCGGGGGGGLVCTALGAFAVGTGGAQQCSNGAASQALLVGGPLTMNITSGFVSGAPVQGFVISQPASGIGSISGSFNFNGIGVIDQGVQTNFGGTLDAWGLLTSSTALRVNMTVAGAGDIKTAIIGAVVQVTTTPGLEPNGIAGTVYSNVASNNNMWGVIGLGNVGPSGSVHAIFSVDAESETATGASVNYRIGVGSTSMAVQQGTTLDAAFAIMALNGPAAAYIPARPFVNAIAFTDVYTSGIPPLETFGNVFFSTVSFTTANFVNLPNVTVTGNYINFPNWAVTGAGRSIFGAGIGTLPAAPTVQYVTCASCGNLQMLATPNGTNGVDALQIQDSSTNNVIVTAVWEAANNGTAFGQTKGNWGVVQTGGVNNAGLIVGTVGAVPLIFGTNNTRGAFLDGSQRWFVGGNTAANPFALVTAGTSLATASPDGQSSRIAIISAGLSNNTFATFSTFTSRGTVAAPTATQSGDVLDSFGGTGWGINYQTGGGWAFFGIATETFDATHGGTKLQISATPTGTISNLNYLTLGGNGTVNLGNLGLSTTNGGALCGAATMQGNVTAPIVYLNAAACTTSLREAKRDIEPLDAGLAEVMQLRPHQFYFRDGWVDDGARQHMGLIADEVEAVDPRLATYNTDGKLIGVDYVYSITLAFRAIQELKADNDNLRADMARLRRELRR